mmetsp:Transcript_379/g.1302  ORF Transcript_379/g.1302 Transcript_379/m.1302 type:complete len:223 (-) Transcript_379:3375-4043(-)
MEVGKLHDTGTFTHLGTHTFNEPHTSSHGSTCGDEIVHQKHILSWLDGVHVHFDAVGSIFEIVGLAHRLAWQLVGLTYGHESTSQRDGQRRTEHQSTCFQSSHRMDPVRSIPLRKEVDAVTKRVNVQHQRGDVPEQNPTLRKVRDAADAPGDDLLLLLLVHSSCEKQFPFRDEQRARKVGRRAADLLPTRRFGFGIKGSSRVKYSFPANPMEVDECIVDVEM